MLRCEDSSLTENRAASTAFHWSCFRSQCYPARSSSSTLLPMQLPWESCVKPLTHLCLGLHRKEPTVFSHTKPTPQLWVLTVHSSISVKREQVCINLPQQSNYPRHDCVMRHCVNLARALRLSAVTAGGAVTQAQNLRSFPDSQTFSQSVFNTWGNSSKNITRSNSAINRTGTELLKWHLSSLMSDMSVFFLSCAASSSCYPGSSEQEVLIWVFSTVIIRGILFQHHSKVLPLLSYN